MKVKVGDKVKILAGKDKGKEGVITVTLKKKDRVVVQGVNVVKKHIKPGRTNETGGILETENLIHVSNVKVIEAGQKEVKKEKASKPETKKTAKTETKKSTKTKEKVGEKNE